MKNIKKLLALSMLLSMPFLQANESKDLINAALKGKSDAFESTLETVSVNTNIDQPNKHGDTPLMQIIKMRNDEGYDDNQIIQAVSMLLNHDANYEIANNDGNNPLLKVVSFESYRNNEILERLLYKKWFGLFATKKNINVEKRDKHGNTPLIRAAGAGNKYAVKALLKFGVNINATNKQGYTALGRAQKENHNVIADMLMRKGAVLTKGDAFSNENPLIAAAHEVDIAAMQNYLNQDNANIDVQDEDGRTALFIVTDKGKVEAVRFLLEQGANPDIKNRDGNNALLKAVVLPIDKNAIEIIQLLLDNDADITVQDKYDRSPCERATHKDIKAAIAKVCRSKK